MAIKTFFSCSFAAGDKATNEFFLQIARGHGFDCGNVNTAYSDTPPEVARQMIGDAQALIAICSRRGEQKDGSWTMSHAVHDEISFAFGKNVPVLMFVEEGVQIAGFASNFGTHLRFKSDSFADPIFVGQVVAAYSALKEKIDNAVGNVPVGMNDLYSDSVRHLCELVELPNSSYCWRYTSTKRIVFQKPFKRTIPSAVWASIPSIEPADAQPLRYEFIVEGHSPHLKVESIVHKQTAQRIDTSIQITPTPQENDFIEYTEVSSSPYINPIWDEDVGDAKKLVLEGGEFKCFDGFMPANRTRECTIEFRFPRRYGLTMNDLRVFVGSYTSDIDYEVPAEAARMSKDMQQFGGNLSLRLYVQSPLQGHVYGVAWNPPKKPLA